ncbi:acetyl-CoA carboxylase, biotin carboxyl carrier protein [Lactobacillus sp. ESL0680]|uniref:acetyl-CoA carboxylase biotin carboxyl carrier protein n=1 Tax=Lactobacillus sp. ESL0680 TaxID=2983210 RepID=UPI0023F743CC|nr:biotin/lipoyl-containing protein [Lactobacillus sp. ESL0680]WEV38827.1 acetyl-CoA carboxylase, biotin carboxyl carrier protein [Lactobacillus sp. ESL0680]
MTFEEIQKLIKQVNQSNITKLNLDFDGGHIDIDKKQEVVASAPSASLAPVEKQAAPAAPAKLPQVKSPLVGIVYLQANPDEAPYKQVGDHVEKGDVVCVIEAMKMMTEVKSDVSGTISEILVDNEDVVEYDQPLFTVTPE